jgi:TadE-like protein
VLRRRQRGQSVVEFGIIAILFTLIMFAIADFGLLLNDWLSVSSGARQLARDASTGAVYSDLTAEARQLGIPGVTGDPYFGGSYCCNPATGGAPGSALQLKVTYWDECTPGVGPCTDVQIASELDSRYTSDRADGSGQLVGTCTSWQSGNSCKHPAAPAPPGSPGPPATNGPCGKLTCPGDSITLSLVAAGAQVITPLVRPFFSNPTTCASTSAHCYISLGSTITVRFEGDTL